MAKIHELSLVKKNFEVYNAEGEKDGSTLQLWAFDDDAKNIKDEPFLTEASEAISALVGFYANKCKVVFSKAPFDGWTVKLVKGATTKGGGTWYTTFGNRKVWLCKVLKRYFWLRPKAIYARAYVNYEV